MASPCDCPSRDTLAALLLGHLSPAQEEEVTQHLETCAACEAQIQALERATDPLVNVLRQPLPPAAVSVGATDVAMAPCAPAAGDALQLEGYRIQQEIGRGGMGVVYLAQQQRPARLVAIKMILAGRLAGSEDRVRFLLEGELLARLNHPNFVQVHEVGTLELSPDVLQPYLVLEHIDGGSLRSRLAEGPVSSREAARLVLVLARAMEIAHAQGIIHRDLKPANVLIARDGTLKISDFGLAKELAGNRSLTPTGLTMGTPAYMAPEQARSAASVGPAADIYALGAILYELLSGRPPFAADTPVEVILQVLEQPPEPLSRLRPGVPRDLQTICHKCLEKDPQARYARAGALADDLEAWLDNRPIRARPVGRLERAGKWVQRHPLTAALLLLCVLLLLGGSAASTYFGLDALERARETEDALRLEAVARRLSDRQAAEAQLAAGQGLADAGAIDHGLFLMRRALDVAPAQDDDLRRLIRRNLEAWLPYLPRLRWYEELPPSAHIRFLEREILYQRGQQLYAFDADTGRPLEPPRAFPGAALDAIGPRGRRIATRTEDDAGAVFRVFDRRSGAQVGPDLAVRHGAVLPGKASYASAFSEDEQLLACTITAGDQRARLGWDLATGQALGPPVVGPHRVQAWSLLRAPDGAWLWLLLPEGAAAEVVDAATGKRREALPAGASAPPVLVAAWPVAQSLPYAGAAVTFWDLRGAAAPPEWRLPASSLSHSLAPDGRHVADLRTQQRVSWYDVARRQPCLPSAGLGRDEAIPDAQLRVGPYGHRCLVMSNQRPYAKQLDFPHLLAPRGAAEGPPPNAVAARCAEAAFSPDRHAVLLGRTARRHGEAYARLVATATNEPFGLLMTDCDERGVFSPSGRLVALATWEDPHVAPGGLIVRVYDARTGVPRSPPWSLTHYIHALQFSPDEKVLAVGHVAGVLLCPLDGPAEPVSLRQPGPVIRLHFSADGRRLALGSRAGWARTTPGLRVWDVPTGQPAGALVTMENAPLVLPTDTADEFLTVEVGRGEVRRWSFSAGAPVAELGTPPGWPRAGLNYPGLDYPVAFDAGRQRLALGSQHGSIYQWDLRRLQPLGPVADLKQPVRRLAYAPDGAWLAAADDEGTVGLFDPLLGRRVGPWLTHARPLLDLAFRPDSRALLTVSEEGACQRWELGTPQPLTPAQWQTWLEAATGLRLEDEALQTLPSAEYRARRAAALELPTPLLLPARPGAAWHAEQAMRAEQAGQLNSARWHLERWQELEPEAWLPWARRAHVHSLAGNAEQARHDLARAAERCRDTGLEQWQQHQAILDRLLEKKR